MKALPLILATSLAANAAWFAGTLLRNPAAETDAGTSRATTSGRAVNGSTAAAVGSCQ
jgi:hypothetical protein